jgi:hypothetical protein
MRKLPDGFKVWVMNSQEAYVSDANNVLLVGPRLRRIGVTEHYIVTTSDVAGPEYIGDLRTSGFSLIDRATGAVLSGMNEDDANRRLAHVGDAMPSLFEISSYDRVPH